MNDLLAQFDRFDLAVLVMLVVGLVRGRKRGMSGELLDLLQWLIIIVVGAMFYQPMGDLLSLSAHLRPTICYVTVYLLIALVIKGLFSLLKRSIGEKLVGADVFGRLEYYLGMGAGMARFACMLVVALAVLHAKNVTPQQVEADRQYQLKVYGSVYFPTFALLQDEIFEHSITGRFVERYLNGQLIIASAEPAPPRKEGVIRRREDEINQVIDGK